MEAQKIVSGAAVGTSGRAEGARPGREGGGLAAARAADPSIHRLFEAQAAARPDATALVQGDRHFSYRELNERANQLAHALIRRGVGRDQAVGICMHRSSEIIIGILATLKAGGAYIPFDPTYPRERLATMFGDIAVKVLLTKADVRAFIPDQAAPILMLDDDWPEIAGESAENPDLASDPDSLAYVIFTSGSTGKPKAAAVSHRGWSNLMLWFAGEFAIQPVDKVLVISSFSFDITQRSIAMPLVVGAELHLLGANLFDPGLVLRTVAKQQITITNCPPIMLYLMLESARDKRLEQLRSLRLLFLGGEAISASRLAPLAQAEACGPDVVNVYGVAECTDVSSFYRLSDYQRYIGSSVPIGRPIRNTTLHLLDEQMRPVADGAPGEICIGGIGVGRGYLNDARLSAEKFVADPFSPTPGAQLYKTGDLGRWGADGNLDYLGRSDHQVKLRGLRIELGEIEAALRRHEWVREAVVLSVEGPAGDPLLVAFLALHQASAPKDLTAGLRAFLKEQLPKYMIPGTFTVLAEMPLNPNGKIDRKALLQRAAAGLPPALLPSSP